ncbi:MAG TPA: MBL fold metallo-hydrolase [Gaiellales bacterium]|jgi:glyoxylase-like metal-dependent hydrolase (beta-lactamase superfamily II)|nr:MBL fold metallo-hydrolase [Gaiellales bacterium]
MSLTELAPGTWRCESLVGPRNMFQYLIADADEAIVVDTGMTATPRDVIMPGMRAAGIDPGDVRMVVVTHPDLDHQGGLAGLREVLPNAVGACGFADRMMVAEPERLLSDRYGAFEVEHGVGYPDADKLWMRANYGAPATVEVGLAGGETIAVGDRRLVARHAPGHSAGHLVLHEPATGLLFSSDAVHWRMCPAADGSPALCPTYEEVDDYLATIDMLESLGASELHSGHWPIRTGAEIADFMAGSRAFVARMDSTLEERLERPATLAELCDHADERMGPFGSEPANLMFVVHGHVRRMLRSAKAEIVTAGERPPRYRLS